MVDSQSDSFHMLKDPWTIYEGYQSSEYKNYKDKLQKVCVFSSLEEFAYLMKTTNFGKISYFCSDPQAQKIKLFQRFDQIGNEEHKEVQIESLCIFKNDIFPEWEDPKNLTGGDIQFEIGIGHYSEFDQIYQHLLMEIIGQDSEAKRKINGLRTLDKTLLHNKGHLRFEIWIDCCPTDSTQMNDLYAHIEEIVIETFRKFKIEKLNLKFTAHKKT